MSAPLQAAAVTLLLTSYGASAAAKLSFVNCCSIFYSHSLYIFNSKEKYTTPSPSSSPVTPHSPSRSRSVDIKDPQSFPFLFEKEYIFLALLFGDLFGRLVPKLERLLN